MSRLPPAWKLCEIGEVATVKGGGTPPSKDEANFTEEGGIPWITPADLSGYKNMYISRGRRNLTQKGFDACSAVLLPKGSVLFSSRAPVGYVAIAANDVATNQGFKSFIFPSEFDPRYVYYYLKHIKPIAETMATGTTFKELSGANAAKLPFLVAPPEEQKRIADKLDRLLAAVDTCKARLDAIPAILKRFRQSVLAAATSGELTEEWRTRQGIVFDWEPATVQDVAQVGTGSTPLRSTSAFYSESGTPWVTSAATAQPVVHKSVEFVTDAAIAAHRLKRYPIGTLLVAMYGEGKTRGQVTELGIEATINQACAAIVVNSERVDRRFVKLSLQANYLEMRELAEGGNQPNLNMSKIKEFRLLIPRDAREQIETVRRVDELLSLADQVTSCCASVRERAEQIQATVLGKAFCGELHEDRGSRDEGMHRALAARDQGATGRFQRRSA